MSFFNFNPVNDIDRGRAGLQYFHNSMVGKPRYNFTFDGLCDQVGPNFLDGFGLAINSIDMRDSQVQDAMERLANASPDGSIPPLGSFTKALSDRIQNISAADWGYALPSIAGDTAIDVAHGAQAVGDAVITTGKSLLAVGPMMILAIVVFIGYSFAKDPGKMVKSFV